MKKTVLAAIAVLCAAALLVSCGSYDTPSSASGQNRPSPEESAPAGKESYTQPEMSEPKTAADPGAAEAAETFCTEAYYEEDSWVEPVVFNTEEYNAIRENGFRSVLTTPLSTFAADVDTASYANVRRMLEWGYRADEIPAGAVRAEEMLNYFSYDYKGPKGSEPFGVNAEIAACPWNEEHNLLMLGLQTEEIDFSETPDTNLVFLIDVSGSMDEDNKLPLLVKSFSMLVDELSEKDRVSIVTYASGNETVLKGVRGSRKDKIIDALEGLAASGATNGGQAILDAYDLAEEFYIEGGNNRVILATDGDFNVGVTGEGDLERLIRKEKEKGIFLSVLGFGMGNYSDARMETLADNGNGNYAYIDTEKEARKVLVEELGANLFTVAKDVKLQIEFNPEFVAEYRQIGYENREMTAEDFEDDTKDGGEIGAGHSVTVLYEIVPADPESSTGRRLKYQESSLLRKAKNSGEWFTLSVRYKEPDGDESVLLEYPAGDEILTENPSEDMVFAGAVAEFAMILNDSAYLEDGSLRHLKKIVDGIDPRDEYRSEFIDMVYRIR